MNCTETKSLLLDVIYEEALGVVRNDVEAHLSTCPSCRAEMNQLTEIRSVFSKLPHHEAPAHLVENVLALARLTPRVRSRFGEVFSAFGLRPAPLAVLAVMILAVIVLFINVEKKGEDFAVRGGPISMPERNGLFVADEAALRERVLANPFEIENPTFDLKYRVPNAPQGGGLPDFNAMLENDRSIADIEALLNQRRKMLVEADADSLMMRGRRLKSMGRVDMALKDFETIYRFYPDYTYIGDVLMYRAQCHAFLGEYDKALEGLSVYAKKYPDKAPLIESMMDQLKTQKDREKPALQ